MQIDVPAHIEKLLFLHDSLVVPGFGGFTATAAPAKADYTGGSVIPPSKILLFSENLAVDDGRLVQDIANAHQIPTEEARRVVTEFVEQIQGLLNQREIVTLPNIGRLYKNYMQKIQFLPVANNFNAASYGLPPLQFSPIARSREVTEPAPAPPPQTAETPAATIPAAISVDEAVVEEARAAATETPVSVPVLPDPPVKPVEIVPPPAFTPPPVPTPAPHVAKSSSTRIFPIVTTLVLLAVVAGVLWRAQQLKKQKLNKEDLEASTKVALNGTEKAADAEEAVKITEKKDNTTASKPTVEKPAVVPPKPKPETTKTADSRECILIVATLQSEENATKLIEKLKRNGYTPYSTYQRGHQVGVRFNYRDNSEIQDKIRAIQRLVGEKPVVKKR